MFSLPEIMPLVFNYMDLFFQIYPATSDETFKKAARLMKDLCEREIIDSSPLKVERSTSPPLKMIYLLEYFTVKVLPFDCEHICYNDSCMAK